ncbi:N-acetylglucosaminyl-phosphatidylinositol de-N-acetylase [Ptychographa xylographoides]|nr:N-acetylglucosaminyl-phosphatidylinositol de-N-acetylase [Ptychographa xylographoides]
MQVRGSSELPPDFRSRAVFFPGPPACIRGQQPTPLVRLAFRKGVFQVFSQDRQQMQQYYIAAFVPILVTTLWLYTAHIARAGFPKLRNKRICLLIAHPDDEAMFFAPTVLALTENGLGNHVKILCLSSGNADGLGATRKKEIAASASLLGLRSADDVFVIDDDAFPDAMAKTWDATKISTVLSSAFSGSSNGGSSSSARADNNGPTATIDVLITFDEHGVSGHRNHISLYHGAVAWVRALMRGHGGWECPVTLYTLRSTNVVRKYLSILDAPFTILQCVLQSVRAGTAAERRNKERMPTRLMYLSDIGGYRMAQRAMTEAHRSQMRWFRWGWIAVGRFMVVNDLRREKIGS